MSPGAGIEKHLYLICWPNYALVASMLPPHEFGKHYTIGSSRYFHGQTIFAEVDVDYRHDYFDIPRYLDELKLSPDGKPKRTKFISCYRVLEHVDLSALKNLYITSASGNVIELKQGPYDISHEAGFVRTFQEICPLRTIVLTLMTPQEFGKYITDPKQPKGAPKVMFCQIEFNIDEFLKLIEADPFQNSPIPNIHPHKLRDQILEVKAHPEKRVKGISLDSALDKISFLRLRTGVWFAAGEELIFYPLPEEKAPEKEHYGWFRALDT